MHVQRRAGPSARGWLPDDVELGLLAAFLTRGAGSPIGGRTVRKVEVAFALLVLGSGVFLMVGSRDMDYYVQETPGPGFLPFWVSVGVVALGLLLVVQALRNRAPLPEDYWPAASGWLRIAVILAALVGSILLLDLLGFLLVAILFVGIVALGLGVRSPRILVPVPIVTAFLLNQVFAVWLRVPLPPGTLGLFS